MNKTDYFRLGHIAKLHGYKGEVSLFLDTSHPSDYLNLDMIFIEMDGILTPYFIENIEFRDKGFAKIKLEGVDTDIAAKSILKKSVYLPLERLPQLTDNHFYDHEVIGFTVIDENYGKIGTVQLIIDNTSNPLLQVWNAERDKEILLPLSQQLVITLNRDEKQVTVNAPEGLIELYLEG